MKAKIISVDQSRQEITQGISDFPLTCYMSCFSEKTYNYINWHWHVEFQLCLVTEGTVIWQIGSERMIVTSGDGIFINSLQVHKAQQYECKKASFFCVDFLPDILKGSSGTETYSKYVQQILCNESIRTKKLSSDEDGGREILEYLREMSSMFNDKCICYEYQLVGLTFLICGKLLPYITHDVYSNDRRDFLLKEILMYIQNSYSNKITLDDISSHARLSRSECCRYFKAQTGQTLFEYLIQYRVNKSLNYLSTTDRTIAQIAQDVGFSNQSYYSSRFKTVIGMTPKEYRKSVAVKS